MFKHIPIDEMIMVGFGDTSFANAEGHRSQGGQRGVQAWEPLAHDGRLQARRVVEQVGGLAGEGRRAPRLLGDPRQWEALCDVHDG